MQYKRQIAARIKGLAVQFPAVVVTGARQVGKTTLLRELFADYTYVSLDSPAEAAQAETEPDVFLRRYPPPLLVDEVQYAPQLFRHLKVAIDKERGAKGRFILTGSQKFTLMNEVSDSLAGRCALVEMDTMSMAELGGTAQAALAATGPEAILHRGMFPELWADSRISTIEFYRSYLATYLERDVRQILNVTSLRDFYRFLRACAARSGQLLNKAELARDVGIAPKTANEWLSVVEASNQVRLLEPWLGNVGKRLVKSPRLYFADTGLLCFLLGLDVEALRGYAGIGAIWETFVHSELRKRIEVEAIEASLWFWRDSTGREVDFVIDRGGKLTLAETKWTELPSERQAEGLHVVGEAVAAKLKRKLVIARPSASFRLDADVHVVSGFELADAPLW